MTALAALATVTGPLVLAAEIEIFRPGTTPVPPAEAWAATAWGADEIDAVPLEDSSTLRASDSGYVTRADDDPALAIYPPILAGDVEMDRRIELRPGAGIGAAAFGAIRLVSDRGELDALATTRNALGRSVRVRIGRKLPLPHGIFRDPPIADMADLVAGIGAGWTLSDRILTLSLRDAGYWLDRPADRAVYGGTGGLDGTAALAGRPKPRVRGGTSSAPVREVAPLLVDPVAGIYQLSDAQGAVVALYERGAANITSAGTVADITAASPSAGTYVVESSARGLFVRLGTFPPAGQLTADCTGRFPGDILATTAADMALRVLAEDFAVPSDYLDEDSFDALDALYPWTAGFALGSADGVAGAALVARLLDSVAARLVPRRDGRLAAVPLRALPASTAPAATLDDAVLRSCEQIALPAPLAPPPFRWRVGWGRNHVVQTSDLAPTLDGARVQALAQEWRVALSSAAGVSTAWRRPSDPPLVETMLTDGAHAALLATALRDLWSVPEGRRLYAAEVPLHVGLARDIGDAVRLRFPGPLAAGVLGLVVGEQPRTRDRAVTLEVLA